MANTKTKYLVDDQGKRTAVILDIATYRALLEEIEDLRDALELDEAVRSSKGFRSYTDVRARLI